jgi:PAS domain S-box-containing protein
MASVFETEGTVLELTRRMSVQIGLSCLQTMVIRLAEALQADHVFVGEFTPSSVRRLTILAASVDEAANLIFELAGSVCSRIAATGKPVLCRKDARLRFPSDPVLSKVQAAACIAVPLKNLADRPIGAIMASYRAPVASFSTAQPVLEILAHRAAAELLHKQEKDRLRKSEERYRTFIAHNTDGMWCLEFDRPIPTNLPAEEQADLGYRHGYCSECNDAAARLLGLGHARQVVGRRLVDLLPERIPVMRGAILRLIRAGYRLTTSETSGVGPDGKFHVALGSHLGIVENGTLQRLWGVTHDITEFKQAQRDLWHAQKVESIGRLAGGVAHDFNNLLNIINGYAAQLLNQRSPADPDYPALSEIQHAAEEGTQLTRQLLGFSRRSAFNAELLNLNTIVERDSTMLGWTLGERIDLITNLDPSVGLVSADPVEISQVIMNLAVNARDAMPGGGKLMIASSNTSLKAEQGSAVAGVPDGEYVQLVITDTGTGMTKEVLDHLFEPFFTTKEPGKGTGLGLSIVYGIVQDRGGYVRAESEPGRGTSFRVLLPRAQPEPTSPPVVEDRRTGIRGGDETILLVDDREDVRRLAASVLRGLGYKVLEAGDPSQALHIAESESRIDLMLTDLILPEMRGNELAERVRLLHSEVQIAFMSGGLDPKLETPFLQKPFTPDSLANTVREVLDHRLSVG